MATNYVLVDFENVQPDSLAALATGQFRVKVFVGAAQAKGRISFELSHSMQMLGASAEYVKIARTGKNAVDMHIAYYVGRLLEKEPGAVIHIISKDTDFDPLIEYLRAKGSSCKRVKTIAEVPKQAAPRPAAPAAKPRQAHAACTEPAAAACGKARAHHQASAFAQRQARHLQEADADHRQLLQTTWWRAARQDRGADHRRAHPAQVREPGWHQGELSPELTGFSSGRTQ